MTTNELVTSLPPLLERLRQLTVRMGLTYSDDEWADLVYRSLSENNLRGDEPVSGWLVDFINFFIKGEEVDDISFQTPADALNSERRYIGFIEGVIGGEWEYDGESESVAIDSIGMQGLIDHEGGCYYMICY